MSRLQPTHHKHMRTITPHTHASTHAHSVCSPYTEESRMRECPPYVVGVLGTKQCALSLSRFVSFGAAGALCNRSIIVRTAVYMRSKMAAFFRSICSIYCQRSRLRYATTLGASKREREIDWGGWREPSIVRVACVCVFASRACVCVPKVRHQRHTRTQHTTSAHQPVHTLMYSRRL